MTLYNGLICIWTTLAVTISALFVTMAIGCATEEVCKPISLEVDGIPFNGQWCEKKE